MGSKFNNQKIHYNSLKKLISNYKLSFEDPKGPIRIIKGRQQFKRSKGKENVWGMEERRKKIIEGRVGKGLNF